MLPALPEWGDPNVLSGRGWTGVKEAFEHLHKPRTPEDVATSEPPWQRLAYDELLGILARRAIPRRG